MKLWKTLSGLAIFAIGLSLTHCDLGTPPVAAGGGGTEVDGIVVDQRGQPAAGVWVHVYPDTSTVLAKTAQSALDAKAAATFLAIRDSASTNANGAFVLPNLPSGTYNLVVSFRRNDTTLALFRKSIVVTGNLNLGTDTLRVAGSLQLTVAVQGSALAGAQCYLPGSPYTTTSDSSGLCTLTGLPPGSYQVSVAVAGLPTGLSGTIGVVALQVTAAGTVNLTWVGPTPPQNCPATIQLPTLRSPYNGTTNVPVTITLMWDSLCGAQSYRLQVSTDSAFTMLFVNDSTNISSSRTVTLSAGRTFFWRVGARIPSGWTGFSESRRFTTSSSIDVVPPAPILIAPGDSALSVALTPTFSWNSALGAASYQIQISTNASFLGTLQGDSLLTVTSKSGIALNGSTQYYWRVRGWSGSNSSSTGPWSAIRRFFTEAGSGGSVTIPGKPSLVTSNDTTFTTLTPLLRWNLVAGAFYRIQVATDSNFASVIVNDTVPSSASSLSKTVGPLTDGGRYFWRVAAYNSAGSSAFSTARRFVVAMTTPLSAPLLTSPSNGATGVALKTLFTWSGVTGATGYSLQVSTNSNFSNIVLSRDSLTGTSVSTTGLVGSTAYYWRMRTQAGSVNSGYSTTSSFTTEAGSASAPSIPALAAPTNDTTGTPVSLTLYWNAATGVSSYRVQVATDSTFATPIVNDSVGVSIRSRLVGPLEINTHYWWRVGAANDAGTSWSSKRRFVTRATTL